MVPTTIIAHSRAHCIKKYEFDFWVAPKALFFRVKRPFLTKPACIPVSSGGLPYRDGPLRVEHGRIPFKTGGQVGQFNRPESVGERLGEFQDLIPVTRYGGSPFGNKHFKGSVKRCPGGSAQAHRTPRRRCHGAASHLEGPVYRR